MKVRRVWAALGITLLFVFATWSLIAYRAADVAKQAAQSDSTIVVRHENGVWRFVLATQSLPAETGFLFVAGSLVDPRAYAPLARAAAASGFPSCVVELPRRGAFGGADDPALLTRIRALTGDTMTAATWVVGGHSRGGVVVSTLMDAPPPRVAGVVLIGTSHPRDVDLSALQVPVTKIVGTRDGLASPSEVKANRSKLPPSTNWIWIEGGNHSHFGWYGFQPGDHRSSIPAAEQRQIMIDAVLELLASTSDSHEGETTKLPCDWHEPDSIIGAPCPASLAGVPVWSEARLRGGTRFR